MGDLSRTASESLGDFLRKWEIPAIPRPRINAASLLCAMVCSMVATRLTFERKKSKFGLIFLFLDANIVCLPINSM